MARLGDYIEITDKRNSDRAITKLLGISSTKQFRESTSNMVGVDIDNYKVVEKNTFAYDPINTIRVDKVPIALNEDDPIIISPAYVTFRVKDESKLIPKYLFLIFSTPYFDKVGLFHALIGVRGSIDMEDFLNIEVSIPEIPEQRRIVSEYQAITKRIENNNHIIQVLEKTAQSIFYHYFIENIDPENLPEGWKKTLIGDYFGKVTIGKTPPRERKECFRTDGSGIKWVSIADMKSISPYIMQTCECLSEDAISEYNVKVVPANTILLSFKMTVGRLAITTESMCTNEAIAHFVCRNNEQLAYTYYYLKNYDYNQLGNTSSISDAVNSKIIRNMPFILPNDEMLGVFSSKVKRILAIEQVITKETYTLQSLLDMFLLKLS